MYIYCVGTKQSATNNISTETSSRMYKAKDLLYYNTKRYFWVWYFDINKTHENLHDKVVLKLDVRPYRELSVF